MKDNLKIILSLSAVLSGLLLGGVANLAFAENTANPAQEQANQQQRLANIKSKGDAEITRRLGSLNELSAKINSDSRLSTSDKQALTSQVQSEITNLTSLKAKLDNETSLSSAITDAKSIFSDYRVYALIVPKVWLIRVADDEMTVDDKLATLSGKLQARINEAQAKGRDVTSLNAWLSDLNSQIGSAKQIASAVDLIIQIARLRDGSRKIISVSEIVGMEGEVVTMQEIIKYQQHGVDLDNKVAGEFQYTGVQPHCLQRFDEYGITYDVRQLSTLASTGSLW